MILSYSIRAHNMAVELENGVWVGVRGIGFGDGDLVVSTTLKGLCEVIDSPYGTAKRKFSGKGNVGPEWLVDGKSVSWMVRCSAVVKIGNKGGRRKGGIGDKSNGRNEWEGA